MPRWSLSACQRGFISGCALDAPWVPTHRLRTAAMPPWRPCTQLHGTSRIRPLPTCRPTLLTATGFAALSLPLGLMKLVALRHSQWAHSQWPPFIAL